MRFFVYRQGLLLCLLALISCSPAPDSIEEHDWTENQLAVIRSLSLASLPPLPPSPSNRVADKPEAIILGEQLFFDPRFSGNGQLSCASCHQPDKHFTDQKTVGEGVQSTKRNTPTIVGSGWLHWFYWDGRRESLWSQALIPFEAGEEMGSSRTRVVWQVGQNESYRKQYEKLFGPFPPILAAEQAPVAASPIGSKTMKQAWFSLTQNRQHKVNTVFANIGKVIAAYERSLAPEPTRYDRYVGELLSSNRSDLLNEQEKAGLALFIDAEKTNCLQCHNGALLMNNSFHNIGTGNFDGPHLDFGRMFGLQSLLISEFNCLGKYSDAKEEDCQQLRFLNPNQHTQGAFKTPSLRNLSLTAPYFHDGRFQSLQEVVAHYNQPPTTNGSHELKPLELTELEQAQLVAFLRTLD